MEIKSLSKDALDVIDGYKNFRVGEAVATIPYFNNKTAGTRFAERGRVGKGSPEDIREELDVIILRNHVDRKALNEGSLTKLLVDYNLGVDCSAFTYYILDAENRFRGFGHLNRRLTFVKGGNPVTKMLSYLHPVKNCDVKTFASDTNSRVVPLNEVQPGDIITMVGGPEGVSRNHILVVREVGFEGSVPKFISYNHSIAYPEDGRFGTGIKEGRIDITNPAGSILEQNWSESGTADKAHRILERARASTTELRRLKWLS